MRQLFVQVPQGQGAKVLEIARKHRGSNLVRFQADSPDGPADMAIVNVSNTEVGALVADLQEITPLRITFAPQGVLALQPPANEAPRQVKDVTYRSPLEVLLGGVQSVGSWKGFLGYAAAGGAVVWIGLFTNTIYLLTASMLIAPFAGPAMNAAVATARGDVRLLGRSLLRYFVSLLVTIAVAALLSFVLKQQVATMQMIEVSKLSSTAVLLPLVAGAAGALNLVQSERSSLVSGAATGVLVAASLAPPAGIIGMAAVLGEWEMATSGLFVLLLQIMGINLSGALVFRLSGLQPGEPRYARGRSGVFPAGLAASALGLALLLTWQFWETPSFRRSTCAQRAAEEIQQTIDNSGLARLVEANVRFTRASIPGQNSLLAVIYVQSSGDGELTWQEQQAIRERLTQAIKERLREKQFNATPLVDVNVLQADGG